MTLLEWVLFASSIALIAILHVERKRADHYRNQWYDSTNRSVTLACENVALRETLQKCLDAADELRRINQRVQP